MAAISAVGIQHLDSLSDVVEKITAVWPRQTVPDQVVRTAGRSSWWTRCRRRCASGWRAATYTPQSWPRRRWAGYWPSTPPGLAGPPAPAVLRSPPSAC
jgi:Osmosensitive K+ channel His kinase sensor domain